MFKIEINTEMTTGHAFQDIIYRNEFDNEFIENYIIGKAYLRGFKQEEVFGYNLTITNTI